MINNHEKLMDVIMKHRLNKRELFQNFKDLGYIGRFDEFVIDFIGSIRTTSLYDYNEDLTEKEYFDILIKEMNINY